jgi:hypothetical protein
LSSYAVSIPNFLHYYYYYYYSAFYILSSLCFSFFQVSYTERTFSNWRLFPRGGCTFGECSHVCTYFNERTVCAQVSSILAACHTSSNEHGVVRYRPIDFYFVLSPWRPVVCSVWSVPWGQTRQRCILFWTRPSAHSDWKRDRKSWRETQSPWV